MEKCHPKEQREKALVLKKYRFLYVFGNIGNKVVYVGHHPDIHLVYKDKALVSHDFLLVPPSI